MTMVPMRCPDGCGSYWLDGIGCPNPNCPDPPPPEPILIVPPGLRDFTPEEAVAHTEFIRKISTPRSKVYLTAKEMWEFKTEIAIVEGQLDTGKALIAKHNLTLEEDGSGDPDAVIWTVKGDADNFLRLLGVLAKDGDTT